MNIQAGLSEAMQEKSEGLTDTEKEELKWYKKMKHRDFIKRKRQRAMQKSSRRKNRK